MKTIGILLFCLGILAVSATPGEAVSPRASNKPSPAPSKEYKDCIGGSAKSDHDLAGCESDEYDRLDKVLNTTYRGLLPKLEADRRTLLQDSERAWVSFRDAQCFYEKSRDEGGTLETAAYYSCLRQMTADRIKELLKDWDD
jgi:uncharacterized protein YecT (DUF1311 family)